MGAFGFCADVQGAPWTGTVVHCRFLPTSHISRQQTETAIRHSWRPRGLLHRHSLWRSCIRCVGPKGMESAAGALTGTRDSRLLQDGIEDLSSLHPVVAANCVDTTRPCNDFHVTARYKLSALLLLLSLFVRGFTVRIEEGAWRQWLALPSRLVRDQGQGINQGAIFRLTLRICSHCVTEKRGIRVSASLGSARDATR